MKSGFLSLLLPWKTSQSRLKQFLAVPVSKMTYQAASPPRSKEIRSFQPPALAQKSQPHPSKRPLQKLPSKAKAGQIQKLPSKVQSDPIAVVGIRGYLEQINKQVFQGDGVITQTPRQIVLGWSDLGDQTIDHEIVIKALDVNTFEINGQPVPATADHIKTSLVSCLKGLNRL